MVAPASLRHGNLLVFGLVGWSWLDVDTSFRIRDDNDNLLFHHDDNFSANGLTFGGGVEWKFTDNLSIRGEYRFTDLDNFDNNGNFHVTFAIMDRSRLPGPQRRGCQRPTRAVHSELALRRVW